MHSPFLQLAPGGRGLGLGVGGLACLQGSVQLAVQGLSCLPACAAAVAEQVRSMKLSMANMAVSGRAREHCMHTFVFSWYGPVKT